MQETGRTVYGPYPRRPERLTKPSTSRTAVRRSTNWANDSHDNSVAAALFQLRLKFPVFIWTKDQFKQDPLSNFIGLKMAIFGFWKKQNVAKSDCVLTLMVECTLSARRWKFQIIKEREIESYLLLLFPEALRKAWFSSSYSVTDISLELIVL